MTERRARRKAARMWTTTAGEHVPAGPVWLHLALMAVALLILVYNLKRSSR